MQSAENTTYQDVCTEVGRELQSTASAAIRSGIEPWRIIPDPGEQSILQCPNICLAMLPFHRDFNAAIALLSSALRYVKNVYITLYLETLTRFPVIVGIGFAKTSEGNVGLIAGLQRVREQLEGPLHIMPMLVGPSRKGFLGRLTGAGLPVHGGCHVCHQTHQPCLPYCEMKHRKMDVV